MWFLFLHCLSRQLLKYNFKQLYILATRERERSSIYFSFPPLSLFLSLFHSVPNNALLSLHHPLSIQWQTLNILQTVLALIKLLFQAVKRIIFVKSCTRPLELDCGGHLQCLFCHYSNHKHSWGRNVCTRIHRNDHGSTTRNNNFSYIDRQTVKGSTIGRVLTVGAHCFQI